MHDYRGGDGGWLCDDISKEVSLQSATVFKLSPVILLKIICFFIWGFLLIYINVNITIVRTPTKFSKRGSLTGPQL